jgi:gluconolactonase
MPGDRHDEPHRFIGPSNASLPGAGTSLGPAPFEFADPEFKSLAQRGAPLVRLAGGCTWAEGPVWFGDHRCLLFSDIPANRLLRWSETEGVSVYRSPSNCANGNTRDREGRLVSCEHATRRVTRTEHDGRITVLADRFDGRRLNSPNDVIVSRDGCVWFTDPSYGIDSDYEGHRAEPEYGARHVFRFDPRDGSLRVVATDFVQPNGLLLSADESVLYVVDSGITHRADGPRHIRALKLADGRVVASTLFASFDEGCPDGMALDERGNVWATAGAAVHCIAPDGRRLGSLALPEPASNVCFGGERGNRLFITASESLYAVFVRVRGH